MRVSIGIPLTLLLAGCGGSALKYTIDDAALSGVPLVQRQELLTAQDEVAQAKAEVVSTENRLRQLELEKSRAEDQCDKAKDRLEAARDPKERELRQAQVEAAGANVEHLPPAKQAVQAAHRAAEAHVRAALARYELEKARLVAKRSAGKTDLAAFESQWADADAAYRAVKREADQARARAEPAEQHWRDAARHASQLESQP